jgi:4-hydroxy-3-methylbut-2-enyl diphosphate reductase
VEQTYFRKGFGLKGAIEGALVSDYHSRLVDTIRGAGHAATVGDLTFRLAGEFGFCYGVDRAVEYAYETRTKFPERRISLVGEIIHNPHVNRKLEQMGVRFLFRPDNGEFDFSDVTGQDVVILPAFGVTVRDFERLRAIGCVLVDTTCGSVLNVWKRVDSYARDRFTAVIHGKHYHEETKATSSQVTKYPGGKYLIVRDMNEAREVCAYIESSTGGRARSGGSPPSADLARPPALDLREAFLTRFAHAMSPGFDPDLDLLRVGVANQTTMLSNESLAIAGELKAAMERRYGTEHVAEHFRTFDTICSATQDRQDAVLKLLEQPLDLMVVIGGYNSSNTTHLAAICAARVPTYHIEDAACVDPESGTIRYRPVGAKTEERRDGWLPAGPLTIGITAGASTPNNKIGETLERIAATRGVELPHP